MDFDYVKQIYIDWIKSIIKDINESEKLCGSNNVIDLDIKFEDFKDVFNEYFNWHKENKINKTCSKPIDFKDWLKEQFKYMKTNY